MTKLPYRNEPYFGPHAAIPSVIVGRVPLAPLRGPAADVEDYANHLNEIYFLTWREAQELRNKRASQSVFRKRLLLLSVVSLVAITAGAFINWGYLAP